MYVAYGCADSAGYAFWPVCVAHFGGVLPTVMFVMASVLFSGFDFFANLPDTIELTAETNSSWSTLSNF